MTDDDETTLIRTLAPGEFPSRALRPDFDWRIDISEQLKALVEHKILNALDSGLGLSAEPAVVIVYHSDANAHEKMVRADIMDTSSTRLGILRIADNGAGKVYFSRGG